MTYDAALRRLECVIAELSREDLELDEALRLFEEGVEQLRAATASLSAAEGRLRVLSEGADGTFALSDQGG